MNTSMSHRVTISNVTIPFTIKAFGDDVVLTFKSIRLPRQRGAFSGTIRVRRFKEGGWHEVGQFSEFRLDGQGFSVFDALTKAQRARKRELVDAVGKVLDTMGPALARQGRDAARQAELTSVRSQMECLRKELAELEAKERELSQGVE